MSKDASSLLIQPLTVSMCSKRTKMTLAKSQQRCSKSRTRVNMCIPSHPHGVQREEKRLLENVRLRVVCTPVEEFRVGELERFAAQLQPCQRCDKVRRFTFHYFVLVTGEHNKGHAASRTRVSRSVRHERERGCDICREPLYGNVRLTSAESSSMPMASHFADGFATFAAQSASSTLILRPCSFGEYAVFSSVKDGLTLFVEPVVSSKVRMASCETREGHFRFMFFLGFETQATWFQSQKKASPVPVRLWLQKGSKTIRHHLSMAEDKHESNEKHRHSNLLSKKKNSCHYLKLLDD